MVRLYRDAETPATECSPTKFERLYKSSNSEEYHSFTLGGTPNSEPSDFAASTGRLLQFIKCKRSKTPEPKQTRQKVRNSVSRPVFSEGKVLI